MLIESLEPNALPQLGHFRERFEIRSFTQDEQKTCPQSLRAVLRMFEVHTGQIASCWGNKSVTCYPYNAK